MAIADRCNRCSKIGIEGGADDFILDPSGRQMLCKSCYDKLPVWRRAVNVMHRLRAKGRIKLVRLAFS